MARSRYILHKGSLLVLVTVALSVTWFLQGTTEERRIILPCLVLICTGAVFWSVLWYRDKALPLFDAGSMVMAACWLYTLIPAIGFLLSGMQYNALSSAELYALSPSAQQLEPLLWRYVLFDVSFAVVYCYTRRQRISFSTVQGTSKTALIAVCGLILSSEIGFAILRIYGGLDFNATYDRIDEMFASFAALPVVVQQVLGNVLVIATVFKMCLIVLVIARWPKRRQYLAVVFCVLTLLGMYFVNMGSRTETVVLLVTCGLAYHRFVKPVGIATASLAGVCLITLFMLLGLMRGGSDFRTNVEQFRYLNSHDAPLLSIANEFQVLFGCTYDLLDMKQARVFKEIPIQLNLYDVLLLIPRQLLPLDKVNPTYWYWDYSSTKGFFSFNPIAQAIVGFDWLELVLRGSLLGWALAKMHAWYARRTASFWPTFYYLFLIAWSYYAIKSSTFMWVYFIIYRLLPAVFIIRLVTAFLNSMLSRERYAAPRMTVALSE